MALLQDLSATEVFSVFERVKAEIDGMPCLQLAAQRCAEVLYDGFKESLVLARVYLTVDFAQLPADDQAFVMAGARANGVADQITADTPVLSLLGTKGVEPEWNDRTNSVGHRGIPLVSAEFVSAIPMVARLMEEMGIGLGWIDERESKIVIRSRGTTAGVFHVPNASAATDLADRKIIPAQDFVRDYGVRAVFGTGGTYIARSFLAILFFTREDLPRAGADRFMSLVSTVKAATMPLAVRGQIYT